MSSGQWNLLEKTELRIQRIGLDGANLTEAARVVADVLVLPRDDVLVIDARDDLLTFDVLRRTMDARALVGKKRALFAALSTVPGISIDERTAVDAHGMLGWISEDQDEATAALDRSATMAVDIENAIASRALVHSTGPEVITKKIRDTNKPWIAKRLREAKFRVTEGADLPDDPARIAAAFIDAAERGFGLVVTTGGVGAEGKDGTVEALLSVNSAASTPYLMHVQQGHGRHVKPGIRIGVGTVFGMLVVCLPGPHSEARVGIDALVSGLTEGLDPPTLAEAIARRLRSTLRHAHAIPTPGAS